MKASEKVWDGRGREGGWRVGAGGGSDWPEYFHLHRHSCWPGKMHQHHHHSCNQQIVAILASTSSASQFSSSALSVSTLNLPQPPHQKMQLQKSRPNNDLQWHFWATFRCKGPVLLIFLPYDKHLWKKRNIVWKPSFNITNPTWISISTSFHNIWQHYYFDQKCAGWSSKAFFELEDP